MYPRVKEVVKACQAGGLPAVKDYFDQEGMEIDPSTWSGHIKQSIDDGLTVSVLAEIQLIIEKFNFYEDVSKEKERDRDKRIDGEGHTESKEETDG
jgi:hypothetical protein